MSNAIEKANTATASLVNGYSSIQGDDLAARKAVYNAVSAANQLADNLGKTILLKDVIVQPVTSENEQTGEIEEYLRTTLIAADGTAYSAGSGGVASSLKNLFDVLGEPSSWTEPLPIKVVEKKGRKGFKFFTIELV